MNVDDVDTDVIGLQLVRRAADGEVVARVDALRAQARLPVLREDLPPEVVRLLDHVTALFVPLEVSLRQYAARHSYDPGTVSRYLSGQRPMPLKFLIELLENAAAKHNAPVTDEVRQHTVQLHLEALRVSNTHAFEVQSLANQLNEADKKVRRAELTITALHEALEARQRRVTELEAENRSLTTASVLSDASAVMPEDERDTLADENARLREEIGQLHAQLLVAIRAKERAVAHAQMLEQQLEQLDAGPNATDGDDGPAQDVDGLDVLPKHVG